MSSCVGPMPPVVNTYLNSLESFLILEMIFFCLSGIILTSSTFIPHLLLSHSLIKLVFLSFVLPDKISLPIIKIAAFTFLNFFSIILIIYEL